MNENHSQGNHGLLEPIQISNQIFIHSFYAIVDTDTNMADCDTIHDKWRSKRPNKHFIYF